MKPIRSLRTVLFVTLFGSCASLITADQATAGTLNPLVILTGFSAKEACSCAFVVEQSDAYCKEFGKVSSYDVTVAIDRKASSVTSSYLLTSRTARYKAGEGCSLDPSP